MFRFQGYWRDVGTVESLWEAHMDVLSQNELVLERSDWPMYTRAWKTKLSAAQTRNAEHTDCLIHDQCTFEGKAKSSVIFCGAEIGKYSIVKDSVVMPNAKIGKGVHIEHAIIGEGALIKDGAIVKEPPATLWSLDLTRPCFRNQPFVPNRPDCFRMYTKRTLAGECLFILKKFLQQNISSEINPSDFYTKSDP